MEERMNDINEFLEGIKSNPINNIYDVDKAEKKDLKEDNKAWKKLERKDKEIDIYLKIGYGIFIILVLGAWEWFVIYFSLKQLNPCNQYVRKASDAVFITLLTTATANILILPAIVLNYLFPNKSNI